MLFADRFVDVGIGSPTFVPGTADRRTLGVQVGGAGVDGIDRWRDAQFAEGTWGIEHDPTGVGSSGRAERRSCGCRPGSPIPGTPAAGGRAGGRRRAHSAGRCAWPPRGPSGSPCAAGPSSVTSTSAPPLRGSRSRSPEPRDIVNNVGSIVFEDGYGADRGFLEPDEGQYQEPVEVFAWCGGSVLLRPRYLADVGLFDERFFLYYEDTDLAWRGRAAGATHTCPTPWCAMCTPHRRARGRRCSSTTSSATGC